MELKYKNDLEKGIERIRTYEVSRIRIDEK